MIEEKTLSYKPLWGGSKGFSFFNFSYYAVRDINRKKGKGSETSFPATSEPGTKTKITVPHSQYKIEVHPNHSDDF